MKDGEIIKALGGYKAVARAIGVTEENALHFERRVIPWKHRPAIKALAKRKRLKLPPEFLEKRVG